jgi:hypothetical protein
MELLQAPRRRRDNGRAAQANFTRLFSIAAILLSPALALAQTSPFLTGATALQTNILGWLTPIAVILVMALAQRWPWRIECAHRGDR